MLSSLPSKLSEERTVRIARSMLSNTVIGVVDGVPVGSASANGSHAGIATREQISDNHAGIRRRDRIKMATQIGKSSARDELSQAKRYDS